MTSYDQSHQSDPAQCRQYGYIVDKTGKKNVSLCASVVDDRSSSDRHVLVYTSQSSSIDIVLVSGAASGSDTYNFLIKVNGSYAVV
jgi:hypothetical protein